MKHATVAMFIAFVLTICAVDSQESHEKAREGSQVSKRRHYFALNTTGKIVKTKMNQVKRVKRRRGRYSFQEPLFVRGLNIY